MTEQEDAARRAFERRFSELLWDIWQTNPLSQDCRPGLSVRPEGDRLIVFGFHKDTGEFVELASLPTSWVVAKGKT